MMTVETQQIHRRKSSKDADENVVIMASKPPGISISPPVNGQGSFEPAMSTPRTRTLSTPHSLGHGRSVSAINGKPASISPARATFQRPPGFPPVSPLRTSFQMPPPGHVRTRSTSAFSPLSPSPLATSFATQPMPPVSPRLSASHSAPDSTLPLELPKQPSRRHARIHSRNLSVFFPRPGSIPPSTISEDGSQEIEAPVDEEAPLIPSAGSNISMPGSRRVKAPITPLGQGFTFGARPPSGMPSSEASEEPRTATSATARRGHHHKHSLSHNFFSFLEPGIRPLNDNSDLHTQPTPIPVSPWNPTSAFPDSAKPTQATFQVAPRLMESQYSEQPTPEGNVGEISTAALTMSISQFVLGSWMWVVGQQVGSLSCTGLGYWVVFDAFGVALSRVVPGWLASSSNRAVGTFEKERLRRPYGSGRVETLLMFAQAVYLMFASVYVCKESVEHVLLSAGGGEGHHHHPGDEDEGVGIDFPIIMTFITTLNLLGTAYFFNNNTKMVKISGNRIPSPTSLLRSIWSPSRHIQDSPPTTAIALILSNPYVATPLLICLSVLSVALVIPMPQHRRADLILACIIAVLTFRVAYRASVVLGTVLLQTSPPRGLPNGKMESFLRAMREVERHPHVLHLPAPHIWQLTPSYSSQTSSSKGTFDNSLVVTLEVHVREDLPDDDVLNVTKWTWEKCVHALGNLKDASQDGDGSPEVTVGVVRG
ncbi:hypothetical protein CPB83DRAFT_904789 [Crepidotus variabilis]|uniref:Cation efflux protein transmembrane domain-containing protein n=1 Tax=Crepidotus variabilis TaxID=179855 RepID=A0A9P6ELQ5_9AGAR|nr:hypothetical protein CPB83DRAFT_904789 [Crepidotus variabilis]